jgi:hypothetical protein
MVVILEDEIFDAIGSNIENRATVTAVTPIIAGMILSAFLDASSLTDSFVSFIIFLVIVLNIIKLLSRLKITYLI